MPTPQSRLRLQDERRPLDYRTGRSVASVASKQLRHAVRRLPTTTARMPTGTADSSELGLTDAETLRWVTAAHGIAFAAAIGTGGPDDPCNPCSFHGSETYSFSLSISEAGRGGATT